MTIYPVSLNKSAKFFKSRGSLSESRWSNDQTQNKLEEHSREINEYISAKSRQENTQCINLHRLLPKKSTSKRGRRLRKLKERTSYKRLHDGIHPYESLKKKIANRIAKSCRYLLTSTRQPPTDTEKISTSEEENKNTKVPPKRQRRQ